MSCNHCGASYPPDSKFCPSCGTRLTTVEQEIILPQPLTLPLSMQPSQPSPPAAPTQRPPIAPPAPVKIGSLRAPAAILAVLCVVGLIVFALFPGDTTPSSDAPKSCFEMEDGFLYFNESLYSGSPELTVPETVNGETVVCIGTHAFYNCDSLTTVFLPGSLEAIGNRAFSGCDRLRGISIPEGVISVASGAFAGCDALEAITIPGTIVYLGDDAFEDCGSLRYIFFSGTMAEWMDIFEGELDPQATVYCSDGEI